MEGTGTRPIRHLLALILVLKDKDTDTDKGHLRRLVARALLALFPLALPVLPVLRLRRLLHLAAHRPPLAPQPIPLPSPSTSRQMQLRHTAALQAPLSAAEAALPLRLPPLLPLRLLPAVSAEVQVGAHALESLVKVTTCTALALVLHLVLGQRQGPCRERLRRQRCRLRR